MAGMTPREIAMEARVKYTADRPGVDPKTVLKGVMSGKTPLLAKGGPVK